MYLARLSIPTHTSALHILLYSYAFFIRLDLRRHRFCRINFRFEVTSLDLVKLIAAIVSGCLDIWGYFGW